MESSSKNKKRKTEELSQRAKRPEKSPKTQRTPMEENAKQFIMVSFRTLCMNGCNHSTVSIWEELSPAWQADRDVAFSAVRYHIVKLNQIGNALTSDKEFLKDLIHEDYYLIEDALQLHPSDTSLALFATKQAAKQAWDANNDPEERFETILNVTMGIGELEEFWEIVLDAGCMMGSIVGLFDQCADSLLQDWDFMMKVCSKRPEMLRGGNFSEDEQFLRHLLEEHPEALSHVSKSAQLKIPDLMKKIIKSQQDTDMVRGSSWIADMYRNDDEFARIFVKAGGNPFCLSATLSAQRDWVLWGLENTTARRRSTIHYTFRNVSAEIREDNAFMKQVIAIVPLAFVSARRNVTQDDDVFLLFASTASERDIGDYVEVTAPNPTTRRNLSRRVIKFKQSLECLNALEETVERTLLGHMGNTSALSILRQGGQAYCHMFREFLGVPKDEQGTRMLEQACSNMSHYLASHQ